MFTFVSLLLTSWLVNLASTIHLDPRDLNAGLLSCYDYIIVGGGISGLVAANRLTEDPDGELHSAHLKAGSNTSQVTVLVLEAGGL